MPTASPVNTQIVGIAYNPKKLPTPKSWKDLFAEPYVSRLGLTGFQTTFGTLSLIEIAKAYGGTETNVEPAFVEVKKALPKVAAVMAPAALPGLFQQGQIDIMLHQHQQRRLAQGARRRHRFRLARRRRHHLHHHAAHRQGRGEHRERLRIHRHGDVRRVQAQLMKPPSSMIPINKDVVLADLPIKSLDELSKMVRTTGARSTRCAPAGSSASTRKSPSEPMKGC